MKGLLIAIVLGTLLVLPLVPRFGQDPAYHDFADQRAFFGVPHFWNVVSNLVFIVVGAAGLVTLRRTRVAPDAAINDPRERPAWAALFIGCLLTGLGSGWYHLGPDSGSLVWDRLPLGVTSVAVALIVLQERLSLVWARRLFLPTIGFAAASVLWWSITESYGRGDLRPYAWCLAVPCVVVVVGASLPARYTGGRALWAAIGLYAAARFAEILDDQIMDLPLLWSGHTWKHLFAGAAVWVFVRWLSRRRPLPGAIPFDPATPRSALFRACALLLTAVTAYVVGSAAGAEMIVHPQRSNAGTAPGAATVTVRTDDGLNLTGWIQEPTNARGTLVLLHGLGEARDARRMAAFADSGYRVVAFDLRAHGESEGDMTTFGFHEARDVDAIVSWVRDRWPSEPVAAMGKSLGSAALCCATTTPGLDGLVLESSYATLLETYRNRLRMHLPESLLWLGTGMRIAVELRTGVQAKDLDLVQRVKRLEGSRVMIVTGARDRRATVADLRRLEAAIPGCQTLIIDDATHDDLWRVGGDGYVKILKSFLAERLQ